MTKEDMAQYRKPEWKNLRRLVLIRDNYSCVLCGRKRTDCNVHHRKYRKNPDGTLVKPWEYPLSELITLCPKHHMKFHDKLEEIAPRELKRISIASGYSSDEDKLIGGVWESTNYSKFVDIKGNREHKHSEKIKASMLKDGAADVPVVVVQNEKGQLIVIDGGTRMKARMELGLPIPYIVLTEGGLKLVIALNSATKGWGISDYKKMYCLLGYESYLTLDEYCHKYPFIALSPMITILSLMKETRRARDGKASVFQSGDFIIPNIDRSNYIINFLENVRDIKITQGESGRIIDSSFIEVIVAMFADGNIDEKIFLENLSKKEIGCAMSFEAKRQDYKQIIYDIQSGQTNLFSETTDENL